MRDEERSETRRRERGFATLELVIVAIILGILAAVTIPAYLETRERMDASHARASLRTAISAIDEYYAEHGTYVGMTLTGLKTTYNYDLNVSHFVLGSVSRKTYCVQAASGGATWRRRGPGGELEPGRCT